MYYFNYLLTHVLTLILLNILPLKICFLVSKNICRVYIRFAYNKKVIKKNDTHEKFIRTSNFL